MEFWLRFNNSKHGWFPTSKEHWLFVAYHCGHPNMRGYLPHAKQVEFKGLSNASGLYWEGTTVNPFKVKEHATN